MKSSLKSKNNDTITSSYQLPSPKPKKSFFCWNFSFCRSDDLNNIEKLQLDRQKKSIENNDSIVSLHYSSFLKDNNITYKPKLTQINENSLENSLKPNIIPPEIPLKNPEILTKSPEISFNSPEIPLQSPKSSLMKDFFLLKSNQRVIIAKITVKNFRSKPSKILSNEKPRLKQTKAFLQQEILKNLSQKLSFINPLLINLSPIDTIPLLSKENLFIIVLNPNLQELLQVKKAIVLNKNIDFIQGNLLNINIKALKGDVIYKSFRERRNYPFLSEITKEFLCFCHRYSPNLVLQIPGNWDISELAILFNDYYEKADIFPAILIEAIKINDIIDNYIIYSGPITSISPLETSLFIKDYLTKDYPNYLIGKSALIERILCRIGVKMACKLINYCEETLFSPKEAFIEKFLGLASNFGVITKEETCGFIKEIKEEYPIDSKGIFIRNLSLISGEKSICFNELENKESIEGSLPFSFENSVKGTNSLESCNRTLSEYEESLRSENN